MLSSVWGTLTYTLWGYLQCGQSASSIIACSYRLQLCRWWRISEMRNSSNINTEAESSVRSLAKRLGSVLVNWQFMLIPQYLTVAVSCRDSYHRWWLAHNMDTEDSLVVRDIIPNRVVVSVWNVSVSRWSRGVFWASRSRLDTVTSMSRSHLGLDTPNVSVSSRSQHHTSHLQPWYISVSNTEDNTTLHLVG